MRDELHEIPGRQALQHPALVEHQPAVLEHPHLAAVLVLHVGSRLLEGERRRVVDRAPAALHHEVRERKVVTEARVDVDVVGAPNGVDGAVAARDRARLRLLLAQQRLQLPVGALDVRAVGVLEHEPPARVGHLRVGERAHEQPERVGRPRGVGVRERHDVRRRARDGEVLRRHLPAPRALEQPHARLARCDLAHDLVSAIRRGVGGDHDLDVPGRVVELEEVLDPACDHVLLVVRGNDDRDRRQDVLATHGLRRDPRCHRSRGRIADVGPRERRQTAPEDLPHQATISRKSSR